MGMRSRLAMWIGGKSLVQEVAGSYMVKGFGAPRHGTTELFKAYSKSPWLRSVVGKIAQHVSAVPWRLYYKTNKSGKAVKNVALQTSEVFTRQRLYRQFEKQGAVREVDDHPLLDLLATFNPSMSGVAARKVSSISFDLKGEIFWMIEESALGVPSELWPIPPHWVQELPRQDADYFEVMMYRSRYKIPSKNMVWIRDLDPSNPYGRGTGYGEALMDEIDTDEYAAKVAKNIFFNKGIPDAIISLEGANQDSVDAAKAKYEDKFRGYQKAHRTMWASHKVTVQQLQQKFADMEIMELRSWERNAFVTTFGVPPEIIGLIESSNRATSKEALNILAREVVVPRMEIIRAESQRQLVPRYDDRLVLDYINPIPEDDDYQLEAMQAAPWAGTRAEWRKLQGLEDRGDVDNVHLVPFNLMEVKPGQQVQQEPQGAALPGRAVRGLLPVKEGLQEIIAEAAKVNELQERLDPIMIESMEKWGTEKLAELGLEMSFSMVNPQVVTHLENFSLKRLDGINNTTKDAIRSAIHDGIVDGDDPKKMARRIQAVFSQASDARARLIARTEVPRSSNFTTWNAYTQSKVVQKKTWVATPDDRVRDDHIAMNGVTVALDQEFVLPNGNRTMYPGETGDPADDCNERCTIIAVVDNEFSEAQLLTIWNKFDKGITPWENQIITGVRKAFAAQETAVLKTLRAVLGE